MARLALVVLVVLLAGLHAEPAGEQPETKQKSSLIRSSAVIGKLLCGSQPVADAVIRLYRNESEVIENLLGVAKSEASGGFRVEGNTLGRTNEESSITPRVRIFHKCDDQDAKAYRTFAFTVEDQKHVSFGKTPHFTFDIGTLNVEIVYPGEKKEKNFKDEAPLGSGVM